MDNSKYLPLRHIQNLQFQLRRGTHSFLNIALLLTIYKIFQIQIGTLQLTDEIPQAISTF